MALVRIGVADHAHFVESDVTPDYVPDPLADVETILLG